MSTDTRGVSDTVGFVLVFGLITVIIAVAFTGGLEGLENAQQAEQNTNVERAFDVLHNNLQAIHRDGVPSRATEMRLADGELRYDNRTEIRIDASGERVASIRSQPIVYDSHDDTEIVYEAGALIRTDNVASVMITEPDLLVEESAVVPLVELSATGPTSVSGRTTVLILTEEQAHGQTATVASAEPIKITITSPRVDAWERYFQRHERIETTPNSETETENTVTGTIEGIDTLTVHTTEIEVQFRN